MTTTINTTLINVLRTEIRAAMLVEVDGIRQVLTVDARLAERAVATLHTNGHAANRPLTVQVEGGVVVGWEAENEG